MKRLKGPEIKMPELRMPKFLVDLYYDLDERHLLPVVAVLIVGIIAIPLLLGGSSSSDQSGTGAEAGATASVATSPKTSAIVVAKEAPGLRDYRHRLGHLHPTDPFKPRYTAQAEEVGGAEGSPETSESSTTTVEGGSDGGASPTAGASPTKPKVTYFTYAIDVRVTPLSSGDDKSGKPESTVRRNLPPLITLPGPSTPALTYIGPSHDGKKAMMLVSSEVTALLGDSKCAVGSEEKGCQLLALEPGAPETVVFGPLGRTYRVELLKIEVVATDHLNRAALGKPKKHGKSG